MSGLLSSTWTDLEGFSELFDWMPSDVSSFFIAFLVLLIGLAIVKVVL